jgi:DNA-binding MarR family transcriptional regulator
MTVRGSVKRRPDSIRTQPVPRRSKLDLADYMPYLVNRLGAAFVARFTADALVSRGLGIAEWRVLAVLAGHGQQRLTDISQLTSMETSTTSRLVTRLIRAGLVSRSRNARNGREVVVGLTAQGTTAVAEMTPLAVDLEARAIRGMPRRELAAVKRALRGMHARLTASASD